MNRLIKYSLSSLSLVWLSCLSVMAQTPMLDLVDTATSINSTERPVASPTQNYCITVMSGFPNDDMTARYQFFRLTEEIAMDATPEFTQVLDKYGAGNVDQTTPVLDVIENIANPVIRQAAPEIIVASMDHLIDFGQVCKPFIDGQVASLSAYDASLTHSDPVIKDDSLFLRQVLFDSLVRLGAHQDPVSAGAVETYNRSLTVTRDIIEFEAFATNINDLEALYMTDLDGRLARSNDMINTEMDREILGDSITLSNDMNKDIKRKNKQETMYTLARILGGY